MPDDTTETGYKTPALERGMIMPSMAGNKTVDTAIL